MSCNLAVTITKAVLLDTRRQALIMAHQGQVEAALVAALRQYYPDIQLRSGLIEVAGMTLAVGRGGIMSSLRRSSFMSEKDLAMLGERAALALPLIVDQLFVLEVGRVLQVIPVVRLQGTQTQEGTYAGMSGRATIYRIGIGPLQARVMVWPGAQLQIFVDSGTFEQAKAATQLLLQQMAVQDLGIERTSEIEQHRNSGEHIHLVQQQPQQQDGGRSW